MQPSPDVPAATGRINLATIQQTAGQRDAYRRKYWDEDYVHSLENQVATLLKALQDSNGSVPASGSGPPVDTAKDPVGSPDRITGGHPRTNHALASTTPPKGPNTRALVKNAANRGIYGSEDRSLAAMEELSVMMWRTNIGDGVTIVNNNDTPSSSGHLVGSEKAPFGSSKGSTEQRCPPEILEYCNNRKLLEDLVKLFLENINSEHQFVPYRSADDILAGFPQMQDVALAFLHSAILATGAIFSPGSNSGAVGESFAQFAESLVFPCFRQSPSVYVVQGLCMLSWRSLALGRDHLGWTFISMAAGMCVHLRLHVLALDEFAARSWQPRVEDIQTFWMFYLIDRTAISILGRNCVLPWRRANVPNFEASIDLATADIAQISFMWQCKLWFLHDEQMDLIFASKFETMPAQQQTHLLVSMHEALNTFFRSRDERLHLAGNSTSRHVLFFHMAYQMALLITLPPFLRCFATTPKTEDGANPDMLLLILRSITGAATTMVRLVRMYRDAHPEQWKTANPVVIHHLLSAGIVHMMNATSHTPSLKTQSARWLRLCMELLVQLGKPWPDRANKTIKVIRVLADRWNVLGALPLQFSHRLFQTSGSFKGPVNITPGDSFGTPPEYNQEEAKVIFDPMEFNVDGSLPAFTEETGANMDVGSFSSFDFMASEEFNANPNESLSLGDVTDYDLMWLFQSQEGNVGGNAWWNQ
ncbi:hypothetical protein BX600DRAFT_554020 [Xylariales sp. PMI_506]|nr:hypothetical protein BX600DRAFT_554020 [Xylariales sp. PMI_506]